MNHKKLDPLFQAVIDHAAQRFRNGEKLPNGADYELFQTTPSEFHVHAAGRQFVIKITPVSNRLAYRGETAKLRAAAVK